MESKSPLWLPFFQDSGIPLAQCKKYCEIFDKHRMLISMLEDLDKTVLRDLGVTAVGDIIAVLRHSKHVLDEALQDKYLSLENKSPKLEVINKVEEKEDKSEIIKSEIRIVGEEEKKKKKHKKTKRNRTSSSSSYSSESHSDRKKFKEEEDSSISEDLSASRFSKSSKARNDLGGGKVPQDKKCEKDFTTLKKCKNDSQRGSLRYDNDSSSSSNGHDRESNRPSTSQEQDINRSLTSCYDKHDFRESGPTLYKKKSTFKDDRAANRSSFNRATSHEQYYRGADRSSLQRHEHDDRTIPRFSNNPTKKPLPPTPPPREKRYASQSPQRSWKFDKNSQNNFPRGNKFGQFPPTSFKPPSKPSQQQIKDKAYLLAKMERLERKFPERK